MKAFQSTLVLIDDGLRIYRQHFVSFLLITAVLVVPTTVLTGLLIAFGTWLDDVLIVLLVVGSVLLSFPLLIYFLCGLSQAAQAAIEERPIQLRQVLSVNPLRFLTIIIFTICYGIVVSVVSSIFSMIIICPLYVLMIFGVAGIGAMATVSSSMSILFGILFFLVFLLFYAAALILGNATYSAIIYGLQPWVQTSAPFGETLQQSIDLIGYRFGHNLIAWCTTALVMTALIIVVSLAVGTLIPLPLFFLLGEESQIAQIMAGVSWLLGFMFVLPPWPIWMALLYQRNIQSHSGRDFDTQVQNWWRQHFGDTPTTPSVRSPQTTPLPDLSSMIDSQGSTT
ncbi:MAG: hypothetical protein GFH27_549285n119 [Chloroflexi bacterium AL-W]|nr:hypothetical protein [Chloroflexi bacterium AL-N1]NOK65631.1 hypothetical protein [Chloroflexi bacterium AL-N10]NOK74428.1 hypothetical protein [Chloroflexi bacterium AL-N5]NOK80664.1 hypothetical protein [Chloroflexi bacterium AL-W]NOK88686.1 hypothetical protein [Chloroflexi bacterium AL-N15]